ncbi:homeobox protein Wariai-like [Contarinia nasturtii]|uniref:homeobox protein Wariai-like n=1 Tax=Contarinia nasturtii TaxID=265458 RepID=UPI0012D4142B|nr:homeobox protein Wariai-like [Contarinia nasturtii]
MKVFILFSVCFSAVFAGLSGENVTVSFPTQLLSAVLAGDEKAVMNLINDGANVNDVDYFGATPLHSAAQKGNMRVAQLLIENGANINAVDFAGHTPLHISSLTGHDDMVKFLIEKGAKVNYKAKDGSTPLLLAVDKSYADAAKVLIESGADVTIRNNVGHNIVDIIINNIRRNFFGILRGAWAFISIQPFRKFFEIIFDSAWINHLKLMSKFELLRWGENIVATTLLVVLAEMMGILFAGLIF